MSEPANFNVEKSHISAKGTTLLLAAIGIATGTATVITNYYALKHSLETLETTVGKIDKRTEDLKVDDMVTKCTNIVLAKDGLFLCTHNLYLAEGRKVYKCARSLQP